jgi:hypothetical protein
MLGGHVCRGFSGKIVKFDRRDALMLEPSCIKLTWYTPEMTFWVMDTAST